MNAVIKRVKVSPADLAGCGGDGSVTAWARDGVEGIIDQGIIDLSLYLQNDV